MKNKISFPLFSLMLLFTLISYAQMPPAVTLPHRLSGMEDIAPIDIDGDGVIDYYVIYLSNGTISMSFIEGSNPPISPEPLPPLGLSLPDPNRIIVEYVSVPTPPGVSSLSIPSPLSSAPLESPSGPPFTRFMPYGEMIGSTAPGGSEWYEGAYIHVSEGLIRTPLGANSYEDGVLSGYVGVYFDGLLGWTYGWINIEIAPDGSWVLIKSAGSSTTPGTPIPAGLGDPTVVPISILASLLGLGAIGGGVYFRRRNRKK
ncbi:MAG TPA: hypothetical protein PLK12_17545 [Prolixibacteraceae bacterium]|nr:hypothetical protein [Prolixibacteraceae bacterium]